jgi:transcriptional regulator with XRE-family HTH domain
VTAPDPTDPPDPTGPDDATDAAAAGTEAEGSAERQRALGARLRRIRGQQGLSLAQVEERSEGRWKAVVVGAYERGDRAVTVERLAALAAFYDVPISHLLPSSSPTPTDAGDDGFLLDLSRLGVHDQRTDALGAIARFARRIQLQRGDHAGRVITLRDADVRTIALAAGIEPDQLRQELRAVGVADT